MKIFISWSGNLSKEVALALRDWLPTIVDGALPFVSDRDIHKGTRPMVTLAAELDATHVGIVCVTRTNIERPWVNFEAGAITKNVEQGRLFPLLVDLERNDLPQHSPLTQFQTVENEKSSILDMVRSINSCADPPISNETVIGTRFDALWSKLEDRLGHALEQEQSNPEGLVRRKVAGEMIGEVLDLVRVQQNDIAQLSLDVAFFRAMSRDLLNAFPASLASQMFSPSRAMTGRVSRATQRLTRRLGRIPTLAEIAHHLGLDPMDLLESDISLIPDPEVEGSDAPNEGESDSLVGNS